MNKLFLVSGCFIALICLILSMNFQANSYEVSKRDYYISKCDEQLNKAENSMFIDHQTRFSTIAIAYCIRANLEE
jgi:hypothetical protein